MGVFPNLFLRPIGPSVDRLLNQIRSTQARLSRTGRAVAPADRDDVRRAFNACRSSNAIVPCLCRRGGIAAMTAEAFRAPGERLPIGGLGTRRPRRRRVRVVRSLEPQRVELRRRRRPTTSACSSTGVLIVIGVLSIAISGPTVERERLPAGEYYALMLFSLAGMMLMATASDLLVIFLALEVLSLGVYVLTGHPPRLGGRHGGGAEILPARRVRERVLSVRHRVHLRPDRQHAARSHRQPHCRAGEWRRRRCSFWRSALLLVGFAFKVSAVPFHMWTPDAYEGAPPAVTGFMSTGVKAAAFAAFARVFLAAFEPLQDGLGADSVGRSPRRR